MVGIIFFILNMDSLNIQPDSVLGKDTYAYEYFPNNNYGDELYFLVGSNATSGRNYRSYIWFDILLIPSGQTIISAILRLRTWAGVGADDPQNVDVHRVIENWDEFTLTWNSRPVFDSTILWARTLVDSITTGKLYQWDITNLVSGWYNDSFLNYGLLLKTQYDNQNIRKGFYSSDETFNPQYQPTLHIEFEPTGIDHERNIKLREKSAIKILPNPGLGYITIRSDTEQKIELYSITGELIKTLEVNYYTTWNGTTNRGENVSSGIYFIKSCLSSKVEKIIFIKK